MRRTSHPVDRNRLGFFSLQKDVHVDLPGKRALSSPSRKDGPADIFIRIQLSVRYHGSLSAVTCSEADDRITT